MHLPMYSIFLLLVITFYGLGLQTSASHPEEQQVSPQADSRTSTSSFSSRFTFLGSRRPNKTKTDPPLVGDVVREGAVIAPQVRVTKRRNKPQWWEEMEQFRRETLQKRGTSPSTDTESYTSDTAGLILSTQLPIDVAGKTNDHRKPKTRRFKSNAKTSSLDKTQTGKGAKSGKEANVVVSPEEKLTTRLTTTDHVNETGNCPTCPKRYTSQETTKQLRSLMFQKTLMEKLRIDPASLLENQGRGSGSPRLSDSVVDGMVKENERHQFEQKNKQIIISATDMGRDCITMRTTRCYEFELEGKIVGLVASAELWWYKMRDRSDISAQTFVVYELERARDSSLRLRNLILRTDTYTKEGWISHDVTRTVAHWVEKGRDHEMLAIRCKTCVSRHYKSNSGAKKNYLPFLIIKYADSANDQRERRSEDSCNPDRECCKFPLTLNMSLIAGVDVIAPMTIPINYCYGFCDEATNLNSPYTVLIQYLRFGTNTISANMNEQLTPCCKPVSLRNMFFLYIDEETDDIELQLLGNIIVDECGCA